METIKQFVSFFLHIDKYLGLIIQNYGLWTYGILFSIIFCETGFVVTPFLPGDSLLFVAGTFSATGALDLRILFFLLILAAVAGDNLNYWIGRYTGPKVFKYENSKFFKKEHLDKTHKFYEKYGTKAIIIARFIPIIRTFTPFIAGIGSMTYIKFLIYDIFGGVLWISFFVFGGYYFGNIPVVKRNFIFVILAIILISMMPAVFELLKHRKIAEKHGNPET